MFKPLRYDEDYSFLKSDSSRSWYRETKFIPISNNGNSFLSFGGDIRYQYMRFQNENWGESPNDKDGFILSRYLLHADFRAGRHFRAFVQLQSSLANGKSDRPTPVEENLLDFHQAFFDVRFLRNFIVRLGRQELLYGSQRLVAVRDGPNNRQSFDAARLLYSDHDWKADFFFSHYVRGKPGIFDDDLNKNDKFWGIYFVRNKIPFLGNTDLYYLGLWRKVATFDDGTGRELRHSIGSRIWNKKGNWRCDAEGLYQFGRFAEMNIAAWTFSINTGYKFSKLMFKPEAGVKIEFVSGDCEYNDSRLQTFNPLFPRGGYFGLISLIGPANLFDIHPSLSFDMNKRLTLNLDCDLFWRYSEKDGIYGPNVLLIYSGKSSTNKYFGSQYSGDLVYTPNEFLYFRGEFSWFKTGGFLKDVGPGKNILFVAITTQLKF